MPYSSAQKCLYGSDAQTPEMWARDVFCQWLKAKLNAEPYASQLGITAERKAFVSDVGKLASAQFSSDTAPPVVGVNQGPVESMDWDKTIGGTTYDGRRIEMVLNLDMGVSDAKPDEDSPNAEARDDRLLASFVVDSVESGYNELNQLGLFNVNIDPDDQGKGRYPHQVTFFIRLLKGWNPTA